MTPSDIAAFVREQRELCKRVTMGDLERMYWMVDARRSLPRALDIIEAQQKHIEGLERDYESQATRDLKVTLDALRDSNQQIVAQQKEIERLTIQNAQDQHALDLIQRVAGDDFCEDLDTQFAFEPQPDNPQLKTAHGKLSTVYRASHSAVRANTCHHVHDGWRKETAEWTREGEPNAQ